MSFFSSVSSFFVTTEADVLKVLTAIKTDAAVVAKDVKAALSWLASQAPTIAADVQEVETLIAAIAAVNPAVAQNAAVNTAIQEVNSANTALQAFATASNSGTSDPAALVAGYVAFQTATAAAATAKAAAASVPAAA